MRERLVQQDYPPCPRIRCLSKPKTILGNHLSVPDEGARHERRSALAADAGRSNLSVIASYAQLELHVLEHVRAMCMTLF